MAAAAPPPYDAAVINDVLSCVRAAIAAKIAAYLDGRAAEQHASQGQTRALVLALKIAEIEHLGRLLGDPPVLLLDDVSSELDAEKNASLFSFLRASPSQVFITTTSPSHIQIPPGDDRQDFSIQAGIIAG